jgi:diacylglycerol kinase family enzyme
MTWAFIINGSSGGGCDDAWLRQHRPAMAALGASERHITLACGGTELDDAVQAALADGCSRVVAGGGDGTVSAVAQALAGTDVALGVLPLGTLNHFAKDLGIPLGAEAALQALRDVVERRVDVGEVNGEVFVNNASLGLYPRIVRGREQQQRRLGRGKWPAFAWAAWSTLRRYPFLDVRLDVDGREQWLRTPFVFVGNNDYAMTGWHIGARDCLDDGRLSLYLAQRTGRFGLLRLAVRAMLGRLQQAGDFLSLHTQALRIDTRHRTVHVATDGEVHLMGPPLQFRVRPKALKVLVPKAHGDSAAA